MVKRQSRVSASPAARRVVVLGASNVTLGLSSVVETARRAWGEPLDFMAAVGHGRSYGLSTTVLGRTLPGIVQCGLWEALNQRSQLPTAALVTDIGNDLIYGCDLGPLTRWLETCLQRLAPRVERLVITRLPIDAISRTAEWKLRLLTSLLFPSSRLHPTETLHRAMILDEQLLSYANRFGAYVVQPQEQWYGWDPIHVARRHRHCAWQSYMTWWTNGEPPEQARVSLQRWWSLQRARPLHWKRFGFARQCQQPTVQLTDGTSLSLF